MVLRTVTMSVVSAIVEFSFATSAAAAIAATPGDDSVQEIVVTAQRRTERLQDVPITVTQVSGAALRNAGITGTEELGQLVPAFRLDSNGGYAQPSIRGVSTSISKF
jgi:iron complex outermembrane receptor protein